MTATLARVDTAIEDLQVGAYTVPTDAPEADGTLSWDSTTLVVVQARGGGHTGLGYTYADVSAAALVHSKLAGVVKGRDAFSPQAAWAEMVVNTRNLGRPGITSMAIAAVDVALWDLKAKLLDLPLCALLGRFHDSLPVYGSGGFTSYSDRQLADQLAGWVAEGIPRVKMKVGSEPERDPERVRVARAAIGNDTELYVDANGAYSVKEALQLAERFVAEADVCWYEEPVSSEDLEGLRAVRERAPVRMDVAAGEYGDDVAYFRRMLDAGSVDVLQADITRCAGVTELLRVGALCRSRNREISMHCGPAIHLHPALALEQLRHLEYFHDHVRIEHLLFDGVPRPRQGALYPDLGRPGTGLELKARDAERYAA